jgi:glycosyltransferase involved in cell wall biosynthesis
VKTDIEVIIPAYIPNDINLTYFIQALESLQNQTLSNFIARIIINGGFDICSKIPKDDRFDIRVMNGKQSAAKARNYGIRLGDSKYVAQLDADDLYLPDKLQKQFDFMEKNKWCSLLATSMIVYANGRLQKGCYSNEEIGTHDQIKSCIRDINPICCGSVMFRRSDIFDQGIFYNQEYLPDSYWPEYGKNMNEDWDMWIRCVANDKKFHILPEELYIWRQGSSVER